MAYVDQAKKSRIAAALKLVIPKGWRYSLSVSNHMTIVCTIYSAPIELIREVTSSAHCNHDTATSFRVNKYRVQEDFRNQVVQDYIGSIIAALNTDNYDHSDAQSDYFNCGHYVELLIGRWNRPFICTNATQGN